VASAVGLAGCGARDRLPHAPRAFGQARLWGAGLFTVAFGILLLFGFNHRLMCLPGTGYFL